MKRVSKSIDGVSAVPQGAGASNAMPAGAMKTQHAIHSRKRHQRLDDNVHPTASGGLLPGRTFKRSIQSISLDVEPERFVQTRPLY